MNVCSQRRQGPGRAPGRQPGQRALGQLQPRGAAVLGGHHLRPHVDREPERGLRAPRDQADLHPGRGVGGLVEHGAAEEQEQRDLAALGETAEVPGRGDLGVEGQRHLEHDLVVTGERGGHGRDRRQLHRVERATPALRVAEQLDQAGLLAGGVATAGGLDADLAAQREGVDPGAGGLGDLQVQPQDRSQGVRVVVGARHREPERRPRRGAGERERHRGTSRLRAMIASKNASMWVHASAPPSKPRQ